MSMICGNWKREPGAAEELEPLLAALRVRETDALGRWADASVAFGWGSRAIGDEGAESPRADAAAGLAITASVRLDGRVSLCETLGISSPDRTTLADSDLLLKSYTRWGRACPQHLLGDFAFALWDVRRHVLFCARDHIGVRPFYYALTAGGFFFASDVKAVLAARGVSGDLDETAVATRLTFGARLLGARTCYRAVRRLLPGHALCVERGVVRVHRWWRPEDVPPLPAAPDDVLAEKCLAIVTQAVRDRVQDGRSVGVHLSGGLDSSGVAVIAARELRRQGRAATPAFAWFPPPRAGPRAAAGELGAHDPVCRREDLQLFCRPPEARDIVAFLRRDGTLETDSGPYEELVQRTAAEQGVEVLLSGWGGDEGISFSGLGYYPQLLRSGRVVRLWRELGERSRHPLAAFVGEAVLPLVSPGTARAAQALRRGEWPFRKNVTFIHPGFARQVRPLPAEDRPRSGVRDVQVHFLQLGHLGDRTGRWAVSGARRGIEYRYPLLDRRVLEFALGLPAEQYRRGRWNRWLMRRALAPVVPPEVRWNPSKQDPARFESIRDAIAEEAIVGVRGMIEERVGALSRSRYLDLPRLLEELEPQRWRASGRRTRSPLQNALRFLDF